MTAIKKGMQVTVPTVPFTMTVDKVSEVLTVGTLWECTWTKPDGRTCRRAFLATELSPVEAKKRRSRQ